MKKGYQKKYSEEFKWQVVQEVLQGKLTKTEAKIKYGIKGKSAILQWMRKFQGDSILSEKERVILLPMKELTAEQQRIQELEKELEKLRKQLEYAEIKAETFEKVIEIAERELKIDIRKKSGTKRSTK